MKDEDMVLFQGFRFYLIPKFLIGFRFLVYKIICIFGFIWVYVNCYGYYSNSMQESLPKSGPKYSCILSIHAPQTIHVQFDFASTIRLRHEIKHIGI